MKSVYYALVSSHHIKQKWSINYRDFRNSAKLLQTRVTHQQSSLFVIHKVLIQAKKGVQAFVSLLRLLQSHEDIGVVILRPQPSNSDLLTVSGACMQLFVKCMDVLSGNFEKSKVFNLRCQKVYLQYKSYLKF